MHESAPIARLINSQWTHRPATIWVLPLPLHRRSLSSTPLLRIVPSLPYRNQQQPLPEASTPSEDFYSSGSPTAGPSTLPHQNRTAAFPPKDLPPEFGANQVVTVPPENQQRLAKVLSQFESPIRFAFAYGSGVFPQGASGPEHSKRPGIKDPHTGKAKKMIDLVLAVNHPEHWHGLNRQQFPRHYSWISRLTGAEVLTAWIQRLGAGLWYIPYVKVDDELVKYGVMDIDTLCADLLDWNTLYVSGRMHKPVAMLVTDARVRLAQQVNLASALRVALLLLPERFTEVELYTTIASLSYTGDFRMSVPGGENADKVRNIVLAQRYEFRRLYSGLTKSVGTIEIRERRKDRYEMVQDTSLEVKAAYAARLPLRLREKVIAHYVSRPEQSNAFLQLSLSTKDDDITRKPRPLSVKRPKEDDEKTSQAPQEVLDAFWTAAVQRDDFREVLLQQIAKTVKTSAWTQSLKGIYTAGPFKSLKYVGAKFGKWMQGRNEKKEEDPSQ